MTMAHSKIDVLANNLVTVVA